MFLPLHSRQALRSAYSICEVAVEQVADHAAQGIAADRLADDRGIEDSPSDDRQREVAAFRECVILVGPFDKSVA